MRRCKASAGCAAILLGMAAAATGQGICPAFEENEIIEELPFQRTGNTSGPVSAVEGYESGTCRIPKQPYPGGEVVYKVRLYEGNEVSFFLDVQGSADLVLALVSDCGNGGSCVSSSADFIGSGNEEISAAKYPPGVYYLYIDSAEGLGGPFDLTVKGVNPTPDLKLSLKAPASAFAGEEMTYELSVTNGGTSTAIGVEITQTLPEGVTWRSGPGCTGGDRNVTWQIGKLGNKDSKEDNTADRTLKVHVCPGARDLLTSTAQATAGNQETAPPARDKANTRVEGKSDLSLEISSSPNPVIAGRPLTYKFTIHNAGPSDATQVKVIDTLSGKETFSKVLTAWKCQSVGADKVGCEIPTVVPAGGTVTHSFVVDVKPSAPEDLRNEATVGGVELEPGCKRKRCGPNSDFINTNVSRETDLTIGLSQNPSGKIAVGSDFSYILTVENKGPSDSSGATITGYFPQDLLVGQGVCTGGCMVTRKIGPLPSGQGDSVELKVVTTPDWSPRDLISTATVQGIQAKEADPAPPEGAPNTATITTMFKVEADLRLLSKTAERVSKPGGAATSVCVGENILYTIKAVNSGPSNSSGGEIEDTLLEGLSFVSSPDGCSADAQTVTCSVPPLAFQGSHPVRIVALATGEKAEVTNGASVTGFDDSGPDDMITSDTTQILPNLALTLSAKGAVKTQEPFIYTVGVTKRGPSEAKDVKVRLELPVLPSKGEDCTSPISCTGNVCVFALGDISKNGTHPFDVCVSAPSNSGNITATASFVKPYRCDQTNDDDTKATTTVVAENDMDLTLSMTADPETVVVGDLLRYTIRVGNQGPATSPLPPITIEGDLPKEGDFESVEPLLPPSVCNEPGPDRKLTCNLFPDSGAYPDIIVTVRVVEVIPPEVRAPLVNKAKIIAAPTAPADPDTNNNNASIETPLLPGPLLLPFFEVAGGLKEVTTLFAIRSLSSSSSVDLQPYAYVTSPETKVEIPLLRVDLHATGTVNLRDFVPGPAKTGYVAISTVPPDAPRPALGGDFVRVDPSRTMADGGLLVPASELCRSWSVRFLKGGPLKTSTKFLFFAPGNGEGASGHVVTGRVFAENGRLVKEIEVDDTAEAFQRTTQDWDLLARSGSIEWTFREGIFGHVAAVHREEGEDEVAVPGFCRQPQPAVEPATASPLILPRFKVDRKAGLTTLLTIRNETEAEATFTVEVGHVSAGGISIEPAATFDLAGHAIRSVNLRDSFDIAEGFVRVSPSVAFSGDFILIDPLSGRAGGALVRSSQLCRCWDVRFVQSLSTNSTTDLVLYINQGNGTAMGKAYSEGGTFLKALPIDLSSQASLIHVSGLDLPGSGAIEWDLGADTVGYVAALMRGEGSGRSYSVLVPGICRPCPETE